MRLYVNGKLDTFAPESSDILNTNPAPVSLGQANTGGTAKFNGQLNGLRIYAAAFPLAAFNPAGDVLTLLYSRDRYASDATAQVEWSATLAPDSWSAVGIITEVVGQTDTHEHVEAHLPLADRPRAFLRLLAAPTN